MSYSCNRNCAYIWTSSSSVNNIDWFPKYKYHWHLLETQQNSNIDEKVGSTKYDEGAITTGSSAEIQEESQVKIKFIAIFISVL